MRFHALSYSAYNLLYRNLAKTGSQSPERFSRLHPYVKRRCQVAKKRPPIGLPNRQSTQAPERDALGRLAPSRLRSAQQTGRQHDREELQQMIVAGGNHARACFRKHAVLRCCCHGRRSRSLGDLGNGGSFHSLYGD
jgi:hypothetical protein